VVRRRLPLVVLGGLGLFLLAGSADARLRVEIVGAAGGRPLAVRAKAMERHDLDRVRPPHLEPARLAA
jgi:hypothetical protein